MEKHEKLGIFRKTTDEEYDKMTESDLSLKLQKLNEYTCRRRNRPTDEAVPNVY